MPTLNVTLRSERHSCREYYLFVISTSFGTISVEIVWHLIPGMSGSASREHLVKRGGVELIMQLTILQLIQYSWPHAVVGQLGV